MPNFISCIPRNIAVTEISGNCIIHPTRENNYLCGYRTTIVADCVRLSFDGYCDMSEVTDGATPKDIMDNARRNAIEQVTRAWDHIDGQSAHKTEVDKHDLLSPELASLETKYDVVPEYYRTKKFNEPMSDTQNAVVYAVAMHNGSTPEEFVHKKLGKAVANLTKCEVSYISDTYGVKKDV